MFQLQQRWVLQKHPCFYTFFEKNQYPVTQSHEFGCRKTVNIDQISNLATLLLFIPSCLSLTFGFPFKLKMLRHAFSQIANGIVGT